MDQAKINVINYASLNKLSVGFLSIVVPLSSGLAGCLTYQFINYLNTKMFIQTQAQNQILNEVQKQRSFSTSTYHHQNNHFQEQPKKIGYTAASGDRKNHHHIGTQVVVDQLENQRADHHHHQELDLKTPHLPDPSSPFNNNYQADFFDIRADDHHNHPSDKRHWFSRLNIFQQQFEFLNDKFNVIVLFILIANLFSMALEILVFKSLAHHTLVDTGLTRVYSWPLSNLLVINYLISTGTRVYFARLASTMLRAPKLFLISSLLLLLISLCGLIFQSVLVGSHLLDYDQIKVIFTRSGSEDQTLEEFVHDLSDYFRLIGLHRIRLDLLQLAWLGPPFVWDLLISSVLMFNVLDSRKRCRFGAADGRISLGIMVMFETMFLVTLVTFMVLCICLLLGGKGGIDFERMNTLYAGFDGFVSKLHTISIFCSLQHKVNDRLRLEQKFILNSQKTRDSALSGYGLGQSVGSGNPSCPRRRSRKGPQTIHFPDFVETEIEASEAEGSDMGDDNDHVRFDGDNRDVEVEEEIASIHAAENLKVTSLKFIDNRNSQYPSQPHNKQNSPNLRDSNIKFPEQAKILKHHHVGRTSSTSEGLSGGPMADAPIGLPSKLGLKAFEDLQQFLDARHPRGPRPHHSRSNPNPDLQSVVSGARPNWSHLDYNVENNH
ncbi:hypothetical protein PGTUg99_014357 [Puccinia graminis f. sp. tritici]|uniref:Uncharacterized protein n=1 Tax=Puccinia graminis f. sp. tritici TaxID=56615 RepID=A0A5B0R6E5_PUCGR|nr:hypothetical protein PGTUg99_014357 [Puccinia graminis f. sp. tritici]